MEQSPRFAPFIILGTMQRFASLFYFGGKIMNNRNDRYAEWLLIKRDDQYELIHTSNFQKISDAAQHQTSAPAFRAIGRFYEPEDAMEIMQMISQSRKARKEKSAILRAKEQYKQFQQKQQQIYYNYRTLAQMDYVDRIDGKKVLCYVKNKRKDPAFYSEFTDIEDVHIALIDKLTIYDVSYHGSPQYVDQIIAYDIETKERIRIDEQDTIRYPYCLVEDLKYQYEQENKMINDKLRNANQAIFEAYSAEDGSVSIDDEQSMY